MRGIDEKPTQLFSYVDLERRIPLDHPLRLIRAVVDKVLAGQSRTFARDGRPGIPPERLLRALLLQAFYSVRSERLLMEDTVEKVAFWLKQQRCRDSLLRVIWWGCGDDGRSSDIGTVILRFQPR